MNADNDRECDGRGRLEELSYRLLLATVFAMTFSIALGNVMMVSVVLISALYLIRSKRRPPLTPVVLLGGLFVAIALCVTRFGFVEHHRLGRLFAVLLLPIAAMHVWGEARIVAFLKAVVFGTLLLSLERCIVVPLSVWRSVRQTDADTGFVRALIDRGSMTDGQMLMLGVLGSIALIYATGRNSRKAAWWWIVLALQVAALVVNFKRGSWICACIFVSLLVVWKSGWRAALVLVVAVAAILLLPPVQLRLRELRGEFSLRGGRVTMWREIAPALVREHPFGVGYGSLTNDMMRAHAPDVEPERDHLHSNLPQILVETGWVGLIVYVLWMLVGASDGLIGFMAARRIGPVDAVYGAVCPLMFAALLTNGLVEYNFGDTELLAIYATVLGIMACVRKRFC